MNPAAENLFEASHTSAAGLTLERLLGEMSILATSLRRLSAKLEGSPGGLLLGHAGQSEGDNNICHLVWQVRLASEPNDRAFAYGDSNIPGSFTIAQSGDYVISIGRGRMTNQCQAFSFSLQVAQP